MSKKLQDCGRLVNIFEEIDTPVPEEVRKRGDINFPDDNLPTIPILKEGDYSLSYKVVELPTRIPAIIEESGFPLGDAGTLFIEFTFYDIEGTQSSKVYMPALLYFSCQILSLKILDEESNRDSFALTKRALLELFHARTHNNSGNHRMRELNRIMRDVMPPDFMQSPDQEKLQEAIAWFTIAQRNEALTILGEWVDFSGQENEITTLIDNIEELVSDYYKGLGHKYRDLPVVQLPPGR